MTVKEAVSVLPDAKKLYLAWNADVNWFDPYDELMMDAFGGYRVKRIAIRSAEEDAFEIHIAAIPVKEVADRG